MRENPLIRDPAPRPRFDDATLKRLARHRYPSLTAVADELAVLLWAVVSHRELAPAEVENDLAALPGWPEIAPWPALLRQAEAAWEEADQMDDAAALRAELAEALA